MKKILLISTVALSLAASSCDDNKNDWAENTINIQTQSPAVVIPVYGDEEAEFVPEYTLRYSQSLEDGKVIMKSMNAITLPDGSKFSFETPSTTPGGNKLTTTVEPMPFVSNGLNLRLNARLTQQYYNYNVSTGNVEYVSNFPVSLAVVNIGSKYTLKTFQTKSCFSGKTTTLINGENPYTNSDILYEVQADIVNRKATVVIYNAKFAEAAPNIRVLRLRNLSIVPDRTSGYLVEGSSITPEVLEGSEWIPNQRFVFDSFKLQPTNDNLSIASINYRVAGVYTGNCVGSYIVQ